MSSLTATDVRNAGGTVLEAGNVKTYESLAALYNVTWKAAKNRVFVTRDVVRDAEKVVGIEVPESVSVLEWDVDRSTPRVLESEFSSNGIMIREEYEHILQDIFHRLSEGHGKAFGYRAVEFRKGTSPPFNPFLNLEVYKVSATKKPGIVVTGTPGIGKSMFLFYVLALRLIAKKTTVLVFDAVHCIIFHEDGAFKVKQAELINELEGLLPWETWFLVDSNYRVAGPPPEFIKWSRTSPMVVLVAASPRMSRVSFSKDLLIPILWMAPFTLPEYIMARGLQVAPYPAKEKVLERFYESFGPIAREAFQFAETIENYEEAISHHIHSASLDDIRRGVHQASEGYFERGLSHKVLIAFPAIDSRTNFYVRIPTKKLADLVVEGLMSHNGREARRISSLFLLNNRTRSVAGSVLESLALVTLPRGGQWSMLRMTKKSITPNAKNQHWHANYEPDAHILRIGLGDKFLQICEGKLEQPATAAKFRRVPSFKFIKGSKPTLKTGFHIPVAPNFPTLDAYAYDETSRHLVIFQMTCSETYELKPIIMEWLEVKTMDVVVVTSYDGGMDVFTPLEVAHRVRNAYRLVLLTDPAND